MLIPHSLALEMSPGTFHVEMYLHVCSTLRTRKSVSESWDQESDIHVHVCNVGAFTHILILHVCLSDLAPLDGRKGLFGLWRKLKFGLCCKWSLNTWEGLIRLILWSFLVSYGDTNTGSLPVWNSKDNSCSQTLVSKVFRGVVLWVPPPLLPSTPLHSHVFFFLNLLFVCVRACVIAGVFAFVWMS